MFRSCVGARATRLTSMYRPNVTITFLRTPGLPADQAKFIVPLWFSKLDLRDYLYHVYNVPTSGIRSYVKQSRVVQGDPSIGKPQLRRWHRPRATKHMIANLLQPFVWPKEPEGEDAFKDWNKKEVEESYRERDEFREKLSPTSDALLDKKHMTSIRAQAEAILSGKEKWRPPAKSSSLYTFSR
jgi:large subunit ribosomal protein L23